MFWVWPVSGLSPQIASWTPTAKYLQEKPFLSQRSEQRTSCEQEYEEILPPTPFSSFFPPALPAGQPQSHSLTILQRQGRERQDAETEPTFHL